jgi:chemotaxis protein MotB
MAEDTNAPPAPIIIKRKKVIAGGHHGGAWKVAYADFVTAMMAFFLLMWLLNATTEKQKSGIAQFFRSEAPLSEVSGGGDGALRGDSVFAEGNLSNSALGGAEGEVAGESAGGMNQTATADAEEKAFAEIEETLRSLTGESSTMESLMRHVVTRVTDEGLVVEVFDLEEAPLFHAESAEPTAVMLELAQMVGDVFAIVGNQVAVNGHVKSYPIMLIANPVWDLSTARAAAVRDLLGASALDPGRVQRISGFADRKPATADPTVARNNRIEMILLRRNR